MPRAALDPDVTTTILANGLRVTTVSLPHLHTATVAAFVKVGARFETPDDNGLSHFVEHMMFRGTSQHRDSLALNTAIERLGGTLHAETGRDYTLLQSSFEPALVEAGLAIYGELFAHPRFGDIELERALILEEINEDYDENDVEVNADDIARGLMFEGHPLGQRIIGPRENVERFAEKDVRRHFSCFYGAKNAIVCVAGPVEHKQIVAIAKKHFAAWPSGAAADAEPAPPFEGGPRWKHVADSGSQTNLALILRGIPELDPSYMSFVALLRCLDDGMSTRLHYQLCDQKGLAYAINAGIEPLADVALLEVTGATANAKVPELVSELLQLLATLRDGVTEADLAKARTRYRLELLASLDDPSAMAGWFGGAALYYKPPMLAERLAQMEAVTVKDVAAAARRVIQPDNLVLSVVGALSRARQGELRQVIKDW
ncbi:MAG TPA: pitrilysin family protein [Kofleriaceae bacterium]|nr:pitrilysin family protein [Kofleriaceae bacterium]